MMDFAKRSYPGERSRRIEAGAQLRQAKFGATLLHERRVEILASIALLAMVSTWVLGTVGAALFVLSTLALIVLSPRSAGAELLRFSPLLLLPLLALASTLWSEAPERTLRAALQLMITCIAAIIICRRLDARSVILIIFIVMFGIALIMVPGVPAAYASGAALGSSLLGNKNQVGFAAFLLVALALAVVIDPKQPKVARSMAIPAITLAPIVLILSQSAGSTTSLAIMAVTFPIFVVFGRLSMRMRIAALALALVFVLLALAFMPDLQAAWADFRVNVLKKDATLTGRTYLWDVAAKLNAERPWLGRGYYAFWRQGNIDAEGLWRWGGIGTRSGFNFHNAYVEMQVDLGWIGQSLFIVACAGIAITGFIRLLTHPSVPMAFLLSLLIVIYVRSYAESGLIAPFSIMTLLWIGTAIYGLEVSSSKVETAYPRSAPREARRIFREPRRL